MKPVAPALLADDDRAAQPTLHSEIRALCDTKATDERITLPAPPTEEALRASTPFPPPARHPDAPVDTLPSPPPSSCRRRTDSQPDDDANPSTIPGPPRMPRIAGV